MDTTPTSRTASTPRADEPSPEAPARWRIDDVTRQRARLGIALAREALREGLERRARLDERLTCDRSTDCGPEHEHERAA